MHPMSKMDDVTGDLGPYEYSNQAVPLTTPDIHERFIQDSRINRLELNLIKAGKLITAMQEKINDLERRVKAIEVPDMLD